LSRGKNKRLSDGNKWLQDGYKCESLSQAGLQIKALAKYVAEGKRDRRVTSSEVRGGTEFVLERGREEEV
jgi:hypothetical protein